MSLRESVLGEIKVKVGRVESYGNQDILRIYIHACLIM